MQEGVHVILMANHVLCDQSEKEQMSSGPAREKNKPAQAERDLATVKATSEGEGRKPRDVDRVVEKPSAWVACIRPDPV